MKSFYLFVIGVSITLAGSSQTPAPVKDIYNYINNGSITGAATSIFGRELCKSDGTTGVTVSVKKSAVIIPAGQGILL